MNEQAAMESEKVLERKLDRKVKRMGGWALKLPAVHVAGLPDRLCLFRGGRVLFVEVKTTGEKPRKIQRVIHKRLRRLGFQVETVDSTEQINTILADYAAKE